MPSRPLRFCASPNCGVKVPHGRCSAHQQQMHRQTAKYRGSRHERGYDGQWVRLREWFISQAENALCRDCEALGIIKLAEHVDHIVPIALDPSRRLDVANLRSLCASHHQQKTNAAKRKTRRRANGSN